MTTPFDVCVGWGGLCPGGMVGGGGGVPDPDLFVML